MNLNQLCQEIHQANKDKGFWPENIRDRNFGELLMLIVSEASELLEAARKSILDEPTDKEIVMDMQENYDPNSTDSKVRRMTNFEEESADIAIRLFDLCGAYNIDLHQAIEQKLRYNASRPNKHGKAF